MEACVASQVSLPLSGAYNNNSPNKPHLKQSMTASVAKVNMVLNVHRNHAAY